MELASKVAKGELKVSMTFDENRLQRAIKELRHSCLSADAGLISSKLVGEKKKRKKQDNSLTHPDPLRITFQLRGSVISLKLEIKG